LIKFSNKACKLNSFNILLSSIFDCMKQPSVSPYIILPYFEKKLIKNLSCFLPISVIALLHCEFEILNF
jgi:hypothetical protein